jgi:hypothetical protein
MDDERRAELIRKFFIDRVILAGQKIIEEAETIVGSNTGSVCGLKIEIDLLPPGESRIKVNTTLTLPVPGPDFLVWTKQIKE